MTALIDLTGQQFGRLRVVGFPHNGSDKHKRTKWVCVCDCGTVKPVSAANLRNGHSKSCGCLDRELFSARKRTHGDCVKYVRTAENKIYTSMVNRCENPKNKSYADYGGRGIKVHPSWRGYGGYQRWLDHIGRRPTPKHTIDRIDVDKGYEPGNVRWVSRQEQMRNTRIRKTNTTSITGVACEKRSGSWLAYITNNYKMIRLLRTNDFFEACCARKSAENTYWKDIA